MGKESSWALSYRREGCTWIFVHPEFLVMPLLMGPVCLLS